MQDASFLSLRLIALRRGARLASVRSRWKPDSAIMSHDFVLFVFSFLFLSFYLILCSLSCPRAAMMKILHGASDPFCPSPRRKLTSGHDTSAKEQRSEHPGECQATSVDDIMPCRRHVLGFAHQSTGDKATHGTQMPR